MTEFDYDVVAVLVVVMDAVKFAERPESGLPNFTVVSRRRHGTVEQYLDRMSLPAGSVFHSRLGVLANCYYRRPP